MKNLIYIFGLFLFFSCTTEKASDGNNASDTPAVEKTTSAEDVLLSFKDEEDLNKKSELFRAAIKENFDAGFEAKAANICQNVIYHFSDDKSIRALVPIFLHYAKGKPSIEDFYAGLQSAYVTKYPQEEYSGKVVEIRSISTLLDQKAEMIDNPNFNRFSVPDAKGYISMSEGYMLVSPDDEDAGSQLLLAGNTAKNIRGYGAKAVALYDWLLERQPDHPKASQALFLKAFTYDNELNNKAKAEEVYKEFIKTYPDDAFVDEAQLLIENLDLTDQEFYDSIMKKNKEKQ